MDGWKTIGFMLGQFGPIFGVPFDVSCGEGKILSPKTGPQKIHLPGQIIATSHDRFSPKGSFLEGKSPAISGKSRLVK